MRRLALIALVPLAACAGHDAVGGSSDGGFASDTQSCGLAISFDPANPTADPIAPIRAQVNVVGTPGVFTYDWSVTFQGGSVTYTQEASDNSQIGFIAAVPGPYHVTVGVTGPVPFSCSFTEGTINVADPDANAEVYRLRAVPPSNVAPPQEQVIQVAGGADYVRAISLDPGIATNVTVRDGAGGPGVPAYVKLMPVSAPNAFTELFTSASGALSTRLLGVPHDALVIPTSAALAPKRVAWTATTSSFVVGSGQLVTGTVRNPAGVGFAGAKVQLSSAGVPSTLGTTAVDGSFSVRADFGANAMVTVKVTPPAASGLPRLEAIGQFTLTQALQIQYSAALQTCNLQSTPVRRSSANQPNAKVTVVGSLAAVAGTVTAGAAANALGTVRIAASADGTGVLPSMLVPRAPLSAVVELGTNDFAVDAIDTSSCAAQIIDAPSMLVRTGTARNASAVALPGVRVEATPIGVLALADAQTVTVTTNGSGGFSLPLASGGRYDVRFVDPFARAARLEVTNIAPASVPTNATLPAALTISGKVSVAGSTQPLPGASVQLLCATCSGIAASRPVAETATDSLSDYRIAVPDPGTM